MERRKEARVRVDEEVTVTVLGDGARIPFQARAAEMSGRGMRIFSPQAVPYQAAVQVEAGGLLLLGEVVRVEQSEQGYWLALKLQHSLDLLGDLHRLHTAIHADRSIEVEEPLVNKLSLK